jgi:uroporphyrinogen-III synthase
MCDTLSLHDALPISAREAGLIIDIEAPLPNAPSMTGALELYIKKANNLD